MEEAAASYVACIRHARASVRMGRLDDAIRNAVGAWRHVDGMMRYGKKYEHEEYDTLECVEVVLRYAPVTLDSASLDELAALLKQQRRVERNTSRSLTDALAEARARLRSAHRLADHIEREGPIRQDALRSTLGSDQDDWRLLCEQWESLGFVERTKEGAWYVVRLATRFDEAWSAKCAACGVKVTASKRQLLSNDECPKCKAHAGFVLISRVGGADR